MTKLWADAIISIWSDVLKDLEPVDSSLGTHCCDSTYEHNGETYRVTWEYSQKEPIGVEVLVEKKLKDVATEKPKVASKDVPKFKNIPIEMLFDCKGKPVCKTKKGNCIFLAVRRFGTEYICNYRMQAQWLEVDNWVRPHDDCIVHTKDQE